MRLVAFFVLGIFLCSGTPVLAADLSPDGPRHLGPGTPRYLPSHEQGSDRSTALADPEECLMCHEDQELTLERAGREISLFVDPRAWTASPHAGLDCLDCHQGLDPYEEPHAEPIPPVDCASCHRTEHAESLRGAHDACTTCHSNLHTARGTQATEASCATCHDDEAAEVRSSSHGNGSAGASCLDCHDSHAFRLADSSTCLTCHGERSFVEDNIEGEDFDAVMAYEESIHGAVIECADCHSGHGALPPSNPDSAVHPANMVETCAECHEDEAGHFTRSEHGQALAAGVASAPSCVDCHGEHDMQQVTDAESPMSRSHEAEICMSCHRDSEDVRSQMTHTSAFVESYETSVHGRAIAAGNLEAAVCSDCHGGHDEMKASSPDSPINKFNISNTCGTCHEEIAAKFEATIHGIALDDGNMDAPTCTDCHGEHNVLPHDDPSSPISGAHLSGDVCDSCHGDFALSAKYGFPSDRGDTFGDSFHGLAGRFGSDDVANCASCHGVHDILPSSNPNSKVHVDNLEATCGACHPGASARFTKGRVHVEHGDASAGITFWIARVYLFLILAVVGGMFLHNLADWYRKLRNIYLVRLGRLEAPMHAPRVGAPQYTRMTRGDRVQHALLALSFMALTLTGFMLKYPDAGWVTFLRDVFGGNLFRVRSMSHRVAGTVMLVVSVYHLYWVIFTRRGRQFVRDIWFSLSDWREFVQNLRYMAGRTTERPRYDRFNYIEKSEYWALVWGTIVMGLTGVILWFEQLFSKSVFDISQTVHLWEAWLAFLAIVVWHFYYVIFNPDVYPMNFTWLTGKVNESDMEHEHPRELERLQETED